MRKQTLLLILVLGIFLVLQAPANATLVNNGVDTLGNRLIYDTDLNITWYDATSALRNWDDSMAWVEALSVTANGVIYTDWRLPSTIDGPYSGGYDGTTTWGWNITTSEMGHLFYAELGNKGYYDTSGVGPQPGYGLVNKGPFENLQAISLWHWSGTTYSDAPIAAYAFTFYAGEQFATFKTPLGPGYNSDGYALAVHAGNVVGAPVPIPAAIWLFGSGLLGLLGVRRKIRK